MMSASRRVYYRYSDAKHAIRNSDLLLYRAQGPTWPRTLALTCLLVALGPMAMVHLLLMPLGLLWLCPLALFAFAVSVSIYNDAIAIAARSEYTHAAKSAWWAIGLQPVDTDLDEPSDVVLATPEHGRRLMVLEMREWLGGRAVTLSSQVRKYPARIDVYETNPDNRWPAYNRTAATLYMIGLTGSPYGWFAVAKASLCHLPLVRVFTKPDLDSAEDDTADGRQPSRPRFCSQACVEADHVGGVAPVENLGTRITEPGNLAQSPFYRYAFTLVPDDDPRAEDFE